VNDVQARIEEVQDGPRGRRIAAFFDFDGTLIDGYSALAMMQHRARNRDLSPLEMARLMLVGLEAAAGRANFDRFMRVGVRAFRGRDAGDLEELGERLLRSALGGALYPDAWLLVAAHHRQGHRVVIASSALPFQIEPLALELSIEDVLCTRLAENDGILTGEIEGPILWGPGKAAAVRQFARQQRIDLDRSYAYGNGAEDTEFLSLVGRPRPINPSSELERTAQERRWPVTRFAPASGRAGILDMTRTLGAYGGMAMAFGAGLGVGLLNRNRRDAVNLTMSVGSDVALSLAGVRLNVIGEENLWSQRPAVFIFNHQSFLDGFVVMKLLRENVTGVAKKEVASQPGFGQFAKLANMAFVDRGNTDRAKEALAPVVDRLREGYSIAISPEGTRSATPRVGPFKKGAFHMAMQGAVPIVPIVIRNAGQLLWRGSTFIRSGTIDVVVHPPISVADWSPDDLGARVAEVRELFVSTMESWPNPAPPRGGSDLALAAGAREPVA
jgi:putative phosphoserine phosphatase/1-acylglycerol-3-phosphate O-acyltransferase